VAYPTPVVLLPLLVSIAIGTAAAILAWRERPNPGATPLVWLLAGQSWWATCIVFTLSAGTVAESLHWTRIGWIGVMIIPVAWLLFALEYSGRDHYLTRRHVAALLVIPALTVLLALTSQYHDLLYVREAGVTATGVVIVEQGGIVYLVAAGYTYLLGVLGAIPILGLVSSQATAFRGQSTALLVGLVVPWSTNVLYNLGLVSIAGIDPTPIAFAISGVAYLGAISRFRMFGVNPAPTWQAKQYLFDHIHEGAIVVDEHDIIVEINETGANVVGVSVSRALGRSVDELLPFDETPTGEGSEATFLTTGSDRGSRSYDVSTTELTDRHGRTLGYVLTLHDVTQYLRQQQRLTVLNRVLRHNIRTETNIIHGYADRAGGDSGEMIKRRAMRIVEISDKGRDAIDLFENAASTRRTESVSELLDREIDTARGAYPEASFVVDPPTEDATVDGALAGVVANLLENAAEHNRGDAPRIDVSVSVDDDHVTVRVADDGPGIDPYELEVLESGTETALEHGSGLGLWLVKWGAEVVGGTVTFDRNDPTGTIATVTVPVVDRDGDRATATSTFDERWFSGAPPGADPSSSSR